MSAHDIPLVNNPQLLIAHPTKKHIPITQIINIATVKIMFIIS